jgi:hypothetical protein
LILGFGWPVASHGILMSLLSTVSMSLGKTLICGGTEMKQRYYYYTFRVYRELSLLKMSPY